MILAAGGESSQESWEEENAEYFSEDPFLQEKWQEITEKDWKIMG